MLPCLSDLKGALQRSIRFAQVSRKRCYCDHDRQHFACQKWCCGSSQRDFSDRLGAKVYFPQLLALAVDGEAEHAFEERAGAKD